jgi:hypothetical protein
MAARITQSHDVAGVAVQRYVETFNDRDVEAMAACFAVPGSILDGFAAYLWHWPATHRKQTLGDRRITALTSAKGQPPIHG